MCSVGNEEEAHYLSAILHLFGVHFPAFSAAFALWKRDDASRLTGSLEQPFRLLTLRVKALTEEAGEQTEDEGLVQLLEATKAQLADILQKVACVLGGREASEKWRKRVLQSGALPPLPPKNNSSTTSSVNSSSSVGAAAPPAPPSPLCPTFSSPPLMSTICPVVSPSIHTENVWRNAELVHNLCVGNEDFWRFPTPEWREGEEEEKEGEGEGSFTQNNLCTHVYWSNSLKAALTGSGGDGMPAFVKNCMGSIKDAFSPLWANLSSSHPLPHMFSSLLNEEEVIQELDLDGFKSRGVLRRLCRILRECVLPGEAPIRCAQTREFLEGGGGREDHPNV